MGACEEARYLLAAALKDLRALQGMSDSDVFADEVFGFHAQQAAEKALKAWLAGFDIEYPRTHDLSLLLTLLKEQGQDVARYLDLVELNPSAVQYRYAAFEDLGSLLDRSAVQNLVNELVSAVSNFIEEDCLLR